MIHAEIWDVYVRDKLPLIKCGYYVKVSYYDGNNIVWEVVEDCVVNDKKDNIDIGLWVFDLNFLENTRGGRYIYIRV